MIYNSVSYIILVALTHKYIKMCLPVMYTPINKYKIKCLITFAQIFVALTTRNLASALSVTVILIPGKIFGSLSWHLSATPTVST